MILSPRTVDIVHQAAKGLGVPPMLAIAICEVESAGDPFAVRYEGHWKYKFEPEKFAKLNRITVDTEIQLQKFSYGLLQVMGTVARELGHQESLLKLTDPYIGARMGCLKLAKLFSILKSTDDVIAAYNAGSPLKNADGKYVNQQYVDKVKHLFVPVCGPA
jgi:soluble lytic murein transglycosylase-like protein